ncbi:MAG: outer membrane beta-barrel protein [Syntrophales bacterium]
MSNIKLLFAFLGAALFILLPCKLMAQEGNINFGKLKIIPNITVQGIYDDNIYRGNGTDSLAEREESDLITHVMPGILLNYTLPERGYVNLGYQGDFALYGDNDSNNWKNHQVNLDLNYQAPAGLIIGLTNLYTRAEDPYGSADQYLVGRVTKRWMNDLKGRVGYNFSSNFRSFVYYNFYKQDYKDDQDYTQNYDDNEFGIGAEIKILPKTWGFIRYHHGERDYNTHYGTSSESNDSDSEWHRTNVGLTWDAAAKLQGELNFGYQWKEYNNGLTPTGAVREDKDTWIAATSINFQPTTTTNLALNLSRSTRDTASDTKEYFEDTGIGFTVQQGFMRKFTATLGMMWSKNDYNMPPAYNATGEDREDDNYVTRLGIDYALRDWLTLNVGHVYNKKDSNYEAESFVDNQYMATVKVAY